MKKLLIIYPHWVPSNLAGVHRPRLVANYLNEFGWQPILLTVEPSYYEEEPDPEIAKTASKDIQVHFVEARSVMKPRIVGDIGLRAWSFIKKKALKLIEEEKPDFLWIPIPSFYMALMGRVLHEKTGIPYGIDYIDPWVRDMSNRKDLRSQLSLLAAKLMEPYAVRKASLISGVSEEYYRPVLERNFSKKPIKHIAFPYGFDPKDHTIKLNDISFPWQEDGSEIKPFLYAGAFLPNSRVFIKLLFKSIADLVEKNEWPLINYFYFVGTGFYEGKTIQDYANEAGIGHLVKEDRNRYPFLHILNWLSAAHVVLVIGSTEKHYTASKIFQAVLSGRPLFSIMHSESTAIRVLKETNTEKFTVPYSQEMGEREIEASIKKTLLEIKGENGSFWKPDYSAIQNYSSSVNAKLLAATLNDILNEKNQ